MEEHDAKDEYARMIRMKRHKKRRCSVDGGGRMVMMRRRLS